MKCCVTIRSNQRMKQPVRQKHMEVVLAAVVVDTLAVLIRNVVAVADRRLDVVLLELPVLMS